MNGNGFVKIALKLNVKKVVIVPKRNRVVENQKCNNFTDGGLYGKILYYF